MADPTHKPRKSKLTPAQWRAVEQRLLAGEGSRSIQADYPQISEAGIRKRLGTQTVRIKSVADQLATAELALCALDTGSQITARNLADRLKSISSHLTSAAEYGAMTAHGLHRMAHQQHQKIDDADPMGADSMEALQGVAALTRIAQGSAEIGLALLKASKVDNAPPEKPLPVSITIQRRDARITQ